MKTRNAMGWMASTLLVFGVTLSAAGQGYGDKAKDAAADKATDATNEQIDKAADAVKDTIGSASEEAASHPGMSEEDMAMWMEMASPGEHHEMLEPFVGSWSVESKFWMHPGAEPEVNQGTSEVKWILDGRFLQENYQSPMKMGEETSEFKGFGLTGYDNMKKQYVGIWSDTMSTSIIPFTGQFDSSGGVLTMTSEFDDPMTGQPSSMRSVTRILGADKIAVEMFHKTGDQPEYQCLELTYTRK